MSIRMDRLNKRLLASLHSAVKVDAVALAEAMGCLPEVAADRLARLQDEGIVRGFIPDIDAAHLPAYELLIVGVPSDQTTDVAIRAVSHDDAVARVFTMAAHASVAFVVRGDDLAGLRQHGDRLARMLGLEQHQGILVVKTFHDAPHAGASWKEALEAEQSSS